MSVTHEDIRAHADTLIADLCEASKRGSVSRHYYAAFHRASAFEDSLPERGPSAPSGGSHRQLIYRLSIPSSKCSTEQQRKSKKISAMLEHMYERRILADYKIGESFPAVAAVQQMNAAQRLIQACDAPDPQIPASS